ncbi:MAG: hypothetical protein ACRCXT_17710 [Paraclostridium sp.]
MNKELTKKQIDFINKRQIEFINDKGFDFPLDFEPFVRDLKNYYEYDGVENPFIIEYGWGEDTISISFDNTLQYIDGVA